MAGYRLWRLFDEKWRVVQSWDLEQNGDFALKEKSNSKLKLSEIPNTGAMLLTHDTVLYSEPFLIRIDAKTGRQLWQREDRCHALHPRGKITPLYAVTNCDDYSPVLTPQIEELNPDTGATIRTLSLQVPAYTNPETAREFARKSGKYYFANDQIYFLDMFGIIAFDPRDGKILFNIFFTKPEAGLIMPTSDPIITTEALLFQSDAGLSAYSLLDGHFLYDVEAICCASSVTPDGKRLITRHSFDYHDQNRNNTVEIDLATGKVIHTYLGDNFSISNASNIYRVTEMMNYDLSIYRAGEAKPFLNLLHLDRYPNQSTYTGVGVYGDYLFYHSMGDGGVYWHNLATGAKSVLFKLGVGTYTALGFSTEGGLSGYTTWEDIDYSPVFDNNVLYIQSESLRHGVSRYELEH